MVGKAIYEILKNDTDVAAVVGTKIYPNIVGQTKDLPFISYQKISTVPSNTKQTISTLDNYRFQISSFSESYDTAVDLAKKVRTALDNFGIKYYSINEYTIKISSIDYDGEIDLRDNSANAFEIAQDYMIKAIITEGLDDWFLPSKDELAAMYTNLHLEGVGDFSTSDPYKYWTSFEFGPISAYEQRFDNGDQGTSGKSNSFMVRACRSFTAFEGAYSLRDTGPAGGLIFYIDGITYYEAAPSDQSTGKIWSNIDDSEVGTTSADVGEGQNNTNKIIAQDGHTDSAAKLCDDLDI